MNNRPFILKGNIKIRNIDEYIIGKIIKNKNIEDFETRKMFIQVLDDENINLYEEGYLGYIFATNPETMKINCENINYCYDVNEAYTLIDYDVVEIINDRYIRVLYRDDSEDNAIVVTNQCNSNCIMCPDSDFVRNTNENPNIEKLIRHVRCIPSDTNHITITGGEPGILKDNLILLLKECKENLNNTEFLLLSNGRVFSNTEYANKFLENKPEQIRVAIPIYADNAELHDSITRSKGSFKQAIVGIKKLINRNIPVEIRIVVLKKNYKELENIAKFIVKEIPKVDRVNIMALEMLGNAFKNKEEVWVSFDEIEESVYKACMILIKSGILTKLYNFPMCKVNKRLLSIVDKSITDYKVRYKEECEVCKAKKMCGGFFNSTINIKDIEVKPIE